jgi:hypothetical protein
MRVIKIRTCGECPYRKMVDLTNVCHHRKIFGMLVKLDEIHKGCPLDTPQTAGLVEASTQQPTQQGMPETQDIKE